MISSLKHRRDESPQNEAALRLDNISDLVPEEILPLKNPQTDLPRIAKTNG